MDIEKEDKNLMNAAIDFFNYSHEMIYTTDLDGFILSVNDAMVNITGYKREYLVGRHVRLLKSGLHDNDFYKSLWSEVKKTGHWVGELTNRKKDGGLYTILTSIRTIFEDNTPVRYLSVGTDITSIIESREMYAKYAYYDKLTGLPNRRSLDDLLKLSIDISKREATLVAILFLDLDGFKYINDNYGHSIGDRYLNKLSRVLNNSLRDGDFICRLGGDEFVILLNHLDEELDIVSPIKRILEESKKPILVDNIMLNTTCSIGVSFYPSYGYDVETLLRQADQAMYIAKMGGKNRYHIYDSMVDDKVSTRDEILEQAIESLDAGHFVLYYQPKVNMISGELVGVEALVRWRHPERGLLYPDSFLPHIRNTTTGIIFDDIVIDSALRQYKEWSRMGLDIPISINIEPKYMAQYNFYTKISSYIEKYDIPKNRISFEIVETSCIHLTEEIIDNINKCITLGVNFVLDDFGVGYSAISNLLDIPISSIKIDRGFIKHIESGDHHSVTVTHLIELANKLDIGCVAEGVETVLQGKILIDMGCRVAQGYYISKPIESCDIPLWIREWRVPDEWVI